MYNQHPYNNTVYAGNNFGVSLSTPPVYSPSVITAVVNVEQGLAVPKFVVGGVGGSAVTAALFKKGTSYSFNLWRSKRYSIGTPFTIRSINLTFTQEIASDMLIVPVLSIDNGSRLVPGTPIDYAHYLDSPHSVTLTPYNFDSNVYGEKDFCLELHFRGATLVGVVLPITIDIETEDHG